MSAMLYVRHVRVSCVRVCQLCVSSVVRVACVPSDVRVECRLQL